LKFQYQTDKCKGLGIETFLKSTIDKKIAAARLTDSFLNRFWKTWLSEAYAQSPVLARFDASTHEKTIQEFRVIENQLKAVTIQIVKQRVAQNQPKGAYSIAKDSQKAIVLREAQKRRRIKPLRKLFEEIPQLLQQLKPCMLMSPLSVASYLGTSPYNFDVVIFDEASQIPPADAIGSILRGSHLIVAGDNRQLPPTRFFQSGFDLDEDSAEDENVEEPLESVLDECLALPMFQRTMLKWHYRSRNEELIDFSNKNIYDGQLVTFPSPNPTGSSAAVMLRYVSDAIYDRGGSRKNIREAEEVADLIEDHFRQFGPGITLGVITFSIAQEEAILEQWERRKVLKPDLAAITDSSIEPFFIKALEKVQGDERDRIIISLGYGKDSNGTLSMNFGPINQTGGERRLNVAVTRARNQVILVSSVLPAEIDPARLSKGSRGVGLLQKYLEYASKGGHPATETYGGAYPESDFEYEVIEKLKTRGLEIDSQVGCSDFRIDLAIRHPKYKNRYILGVECDGATYHSQRSARDRDKLRQDILEKLGWQIYRVWSTDWVANSDRIVEAIVSRVQQIGESSGVQVPFALSHPTENSENGKTERIAPLVGPALAEVIPSPNPYGLAEYDPYVVHAKGRKENFYHLGESSRGLSLLAAEIQSIVSKESPVHLDAVSRKISASYGLQRVGPNIQEIVDKAIKVGISRKLFARKGTFLWNERSVIPRIPKLGDSPRPIEEIAEEEIGKTLHVIVEREMGISRDSLIRTGGQVLGYDRTGVRVESRIGEIIDALLRNGEFVMYGEQVTLRVHDARVTSGTLSPID
jgi:very-short-patch-repair endonuclease